MHKIYLKSLFRISKKSHKVTTWFVVAFLLLGSLVPAYNAVEMKALMLSAQIFTDKPFMAEYYNILEFSQNIVNGFYIAQCIAKGVSPKASKKSLPKKDIRNNDRAAASGSITQYEKNENLGFAQAQVSAANLFCYTEALWQGEVFKLGVSPRDSIEFYILVLFLMLFLLPRGSLDPSVINLNTNNLWIGNPAK
ncbi:MAG: hypothetical protein LHV68_00660 [Elusimicrobia bacterium]|nr:hypothetical protein [Candidatus Liberimonas magnetica]